MTRTATTRTAWRERVGKPPFRVIVHERDDGADAVPIVYLKWVGRDGKRTGRSLRTTIRRGNGRLDPVAQNWCIEQAKAQSEALLQAHILAAASAQSTTALDVQAIRNDLAALGKELAALGKSVARIEGEIRDLAAKLAPSFA